MLEEFLLFYRNIYIIFSLINFNRILEKVYIIEVDVVFGLSLLFLNVKNFKFLYVCNIYVKNVVVCINFKKV